MNPLQALPAEIVLRILDYSPVSDLAHLTRLNSSWHQFIDGTHQEAIYSLPTKTTTPSGGKDLSCLTESTSFVNYFDDITSFKELWQTTNALST